MQEVPDPYGGSAASVVDTELPFLRGTWRLRTHPRAGNRSGRQEGAWSVGLATPSFARSYG